MMREDALLLWDRVALAVCAILVMHIPPIERSGNRGCSTGSLHTMNRWNPQLFVNVSERFENPRA